MENIINAVLKTSKGDIKLELWPDKAPETVDNFVSLALGEKDWADPKTGQKVNRPFYNGTVFHRVIDDFMIQGGCPIGNGTGGPGYDFEDECYDGEGKLKAKVEYGVIAMANAGPNTNGSQFFIVTRKSGCDWLNGKHTVFGRVTEGMEVAHSIENAPRGPMDKPLEKIEIKSVEIKK
ncbi:MAG: peptidylprolyl isomerase [Candidatus Delongbacteria bacterium]|jgi:peptidyl-prolyl cis-trans isomerase A (cyclophilin A)|nr:peptidylprolyl isomerase [Candidatus Delongbacteria bacterium]